MASVVSLAIFLTLVSAALAKKRGEACMATVECYDTGLVCTGARCYCYMDLSPEIARYWACNVDEDCPVIQKSLPEDNGIGSGMAIENDWEITSSNQSKKLRCIPSIECPLVEGFIGYCNVERNGTS